MGIDKGMFVPKLDGEEMLWAALLAKEQP